MRMLAFVGAMLLTLVVPVAVQAADTCHCFCGLANSSAYLAYDDAIPQSECTERCDAAGDIVVGCYEERDQWPDKSVLCWTQPECASQGDGYTWVDDVTTCWDGGPMPMGYCLAPLKQVTLLQPFGGNTSFSGVADYASAAYEFMVPVMAMVAVVILMISGLQYILAGGNPDQIKRAKSRMTGAVTGLILLLSAWTIANVLDPRLVNLQQLRVPAQKKVVLLDPNSSCESLANHGIGISETASGTIYYDTEVTGDCGEEGYVRDLNGKDDLGIDENAVVGNWEEGMRCNYNGCGEGSACATVEGGEKECVSCSMAGVELEYVSPDVCAAFQSITADQGDKETLCTYLQNPEDAFGVDLGPMCGMSILNCPEWFSDGAGCRDYDEVTVTGLNEGDTTGIDYGAGARADEMLSAAQFKTYCEADYCNLAGARGCKVAQDTDGLDCVGTADAYTVVEGEIASSLTCLNSGGMVYDCAEGE